MLSCSWGVPGTVAGWVEAAVTLTTSPALSVLFWMPIALVIASLLTVGAVVSTLKPALSVTDAAVSVAVLPAGSVIVPPLRLKALALMLMPLASVWPARMV